MTPEEIAELRSIAEAVNWCNWTADGPKVLGTNIWTTLICTVPHGRLVDFTDEAAAKVARHIAAFSPERVLRLLDLLEERAWPHGGVPSGPRDGGAAGLG